MKRVQNYCVKMEKIFHETGRKWIMEFILNGKINDYIYLIIDTKRLIIKLSFSHMSFSLSNTFFLSITKHFTKEGKMGKKKQRKMEGKTWAKSKTRQVIEQTNLSLKCLNLSLCRLYTRKEEIPTMIKLWKVCKCWCEVRDNEIERRRRRREMGMYI